MEDILKGKIFLAIKNKRLCSNDETKGIVQGYIGGDYYLIKFLHWDMENDNETTFSMVNDLSSTLSEKIIHIKDMKEWLFFSNDNDFQKDINLDLNIKKLISNYINGE